MRPVDFRAAKIETDWYKTQQSQAMITTYLNVLHYFPPRNIKQAKLGEAKKNSRPTDESYALYIIL